MVARPVVAIVGRPNVGKSALFNRLIGRRLAIVEGHPGITRDRLYAPASWGNRAFTLVDTGGLISDAAESIPAQVRVQAERAIAEADVIIFVVDAGDGVVPEDHEVAQRLRESRRPVVLAVNKADRPDHPGIYDFFALGLGDPMSVSAIHGLGINDLMDAVVARLPERGPEPGLPPAVRVALVGRPNVGKSSLLNAILGEDRVIVDAVPGTTRDAVDTPFLRDGRTFVLVDTAGLRRKARIDRPLERFSAGRSLGAIDRADVVVLVLDATEPIVEQDQEIARYTLERGRALVVAVSKWDRVSRSPEPHRAMLDRVRSGLRFVGYAEIVVTSAPLGWGIPELFGQILRAADAHGRRVSTGKLNRIIEQAEQAHFPPADRFGRQGKIYYATQPGAHPPTIVLFVNDPSLFPDEYARYLEGRLRRAFDFEGTPVRLLFRPRERSREVSPS
ncbi:MAG TPA: ribosome biogenesis GTPase Der [bacterium]